MRNFGPSWRHHRHAGERQQIAAELERAVTQHQQGEAAFDW